MRYIDASALGSWDVARVPLGVVLPIKSILVTCYPIVYYLIQVSQCHLMSMLTKRRVADLTLSAPLLRFNHTTDTTSSS